MVRRIVDNKQKNGDLDVKRSTTTAALLIMVSVIGCTQKAETVPPSPVVKEAVDVGPGQLRAVETTTASAIVVGIDAASRTVTLKRANGEVFNVVAGAEVRNFSQIKTGDMVTAEFTRALSLDLRKASGQAAYRIDEGAAARARAGERPVGVAGRQVTVLADIVAIDPARQVVTLRGPLGNVVHLVVPDAAQLKNVSVGDQVEAVYTEALAIAVEAMSQPATK